MVNLGTCTCACCAIWRLLFLRKNSKIDEYDAFRILEQQIFDMSSLIEKQDDEIKALKNIIHQSSYSESEEDEDPK